MSQDLIGRLFSVAGKVTLITGGSSGLGLMMAEAYLRAGARVYITGRKPGPLESARAELSPHGDVRSIQGDVAQPEGIQAILDALRDEPRLDVLINNAGITWGAPLETFPAAAWDSVMAVNVKAPFVLVQALLPRLQAAASAAEPARVINIGSIYGVAAHVQTAWSYAASKSAIHQLTTVLAAELAPRKILVNAIAPGFFPSRMQRFVLSDEQRTAAALQMIPLGRAGTLEDIGGLALYLGSRASAYMTGNIIPLDGGVLANR